MKGETELDIATECAWQLWGSREVFLRLGYTHDQVTAGVGVLVGHLGRAGGDVPPLHGYVKLNDNGKEFQIPGPRTAFDGPRFLELYRALLTAISAGTYSEAELQRQYQRSVAYVGRHEIVTALQDEGHDPKPRNLEGLSN